ncbi:MAG: histidine phosphatase family protein [Oligoflexia bacterium]|nr:histidine phosphatase family protein [Oligoflexia bacterium]
MSTPVRRSPRQQVWLVRHGQTTWSASGQHTGRTDIPLTPIGMHQARSLGPRLAASTFALVLTSPLVRAQETCRLAGQLGAAQVEGDLAEWDYGVFDGRTTAEIRRERPGWTVWDGPLPDGETVDHVGVRADRIIDRVRAAQGNVLLFGHAHMLRILAARWVGLSPRHGQRLGLDTASISVLGFEHELGVIHTWNQTWNQTVPPSTEPSSSSTASPGPSHGVQT